MGAAVVNFTSLPFVLPSAFSDTIRIDKPQLWSPQSPNLYTVHFTVTADGKKVSGYDLHSGIRSIKVSNGRLILNGQALNFRGVGLHEDSKSDGFAIDDARRLQLMNQVKELGGTMPSVKLIYADPPYNTGQKDFRYSDRRFHDPDAGGFFSTAVSTPPARVRSPAVAIRIMLS